MRPCNDEERQLLPLPVKLVGMGITNVKSISDIEYQTSKRQRKARWIKSKIKKNEAALILKTAATNKKSLNLQPNFMTTFSETLKVK